MRLLLIVSVVLMACGGGGEGDGFTEIEADAIDPMCDAFCDRADECGFGCFERGECHQRFCTDFTECATEWRVPIELVDRCAAAERDIPCAEGEDPAQTQACIDMFDYGPPPALDN